jgi:hypothetical protein
VFERAAALSNRPGIGMIFLLIYRMRTWTRLLKTWKRIADEGCNSLQYDNILERAVEWVLSSRHPAHGQLMSLGTTGRAAFRSKFGDQYVGHFCSRPTIISDSRKRAHMLFHSCRIFTEQSANSATNGHLYSKPRNVIPLERYSRIFKITVIHNQG